MISAIASMYSDGGKSAWIRDCLQRYAPRVVKKKPRKRKTRKQG